MSSLRRGHANLLCIVPVFSICAAEASTWLFLNTWQEWSQDWTPNSREWEENAAKGLESSIQRERPSWNFLPWWTLEPGREAAAWAGWPEQAGERGGSCCPSCHLFMSLSPLLHPLISDFFISSPRLKAFFFWLNCAACGILVPQPEIELGSWQWKLWVLTTGQPRNSHLRRLLKNIWSFFIVVTYTHNKIYHFNI